MQYFQPDSLPYNTAPDYWIAVAGEPAHTLALTDHGYVAQETGVYLTRVVSAWYDAWTALDGLIAQLPGAAVKELSIAVIPGDAEPSALVVSQNLQPVAEMRTIAGSLWLGDALLADRVVCYLQPIQDRRGKIFGYESFARVQLDKDNVISGGPIFAAGKALKLEYRLDRYLHQKAVEAFATSGMSSRLFINFQAGFIHRPEVYLEGLNQVVKKYSVPARNIVLEFTQSQSLHNVQHMKAICHYCRQQGYSISLDDITDAEALEALLGMIKPDFIKLDMFITHEAASRREHSLILQLVKTAHELGITVIAEGIETQVIHDILMEAGIDLFQGFLIGYPAPYTSSPLVKSASS